ncbi:MAG: hypothetical protein Q7S87_10020 [Agitococcus sp.]|nr:hypothetical protein [Agitococcus sp.]MDO9179332.1 hypothetical protein [Agitococcus sp.]
MNEAGLTTVDIPNMLISAVLLPCAMLMIYAFSRYSHNRAEKVKMERRSHLEISALDYQLLQKVAVLSPVGREHLQGWVTTGPILRREYDNKTKILYEDANKFAPLMEQGLLAEVKRDITQMASIRTK